MKYKSAAMWDHASEGPLKNGGIMKGTSIKITGMISR